jgi:hypothetical protein
MMVVVVAVGMTGIGGRPLYGDMKYGVVEYK